MSEANFDIDAAAEQFDKGKAPEGDAPPAEGKQEFDTFDGDEPAKGHKSFEEYVADGGDPDRYKGRQAFEDERERIAENKSLKKEVKSLKDTVRQTNDAVGDLVQQARDDERSKIESRIEKAKEDEDFDAFEQAQDDLAEHDKKAPATREEFVEPDVVLDFREEHTILDREHDDFDPEFNLDMTAAFNELLARQSQGGKRQLSDKAWQRLLKKAYRETRDLYELGDEAEPEAEDEGEPDVSPRNTRRQGATSRRRAAGREEAPKAENFKISNPRNNRDHDASGVRDMIHQNAYKAAKKAGKSDDDAQKSAETAAKNFERSLHQ